jgi:DNA-3-methyladenine glycosylase I
MKKAVVRCAWAGSDALMCAYHDEEWGRAERDSRKLWEALMLDGFQAGLAWITILRKREAFRKAFGGFDPQVVARYKEKDIARLMGDAGIVRSRAKIEATIQGAKIYLEMDKAGEDFSEWVWGLAGGKVVRGERRAGERRTMADVPAKTEVSEAMSAALKKRGFKFVGPVIVYAWMQAVGMVDDHVEGCFRYTRDKGNSQG